VNLRVVHQVLTSVAPPPPPGPAVFVVAECREGDWMFADGWRQDCSSLEEAREVAARWRTGEPGRAPWPVAVFALVPVDEETGQVRL
jgi:hypothetical protein